MKNESDLRSIQERYWDRDGLNQRRKHSHPVVKAFIESKIKAIEGYINFNEGYKCLELGAGNGFYSFYLDQFFDLTATDFSPKMIGLNPVSNKFVMDASNIEFPNDSFDIVFESCMLHHIDCVDKVLGEMARVSKKYVIITEPNRNNPLVFLFGLLVKEERELLKFSTNFVIKKIRKNNLQLLAAFSHGVIMPNKTPKWLLPVSKIFDRKLPFGGFDNIFICEKKSKHY